MNKFFTIILIVAVTFVFSSCQKEKPDVKSVDNINPVKTDNSIKFINKELVKTYNNCKPGEPNCTYIRLSFIEATDGKIKEKVNKLINSQLLFAYEMPDAHYSSLDQMEATFIRDYESFRKEMPSAPQVWSVEMKFGIASENDRMLCIGGELYSYLGGAHPSLMHGYLNIDKETGDTIPLKTLFKPDFEKKLNAIIDKKFREQKGLKPGDNLSEKGDLFENKIELTYNAGITKEKGLEFIYNASDIAPYAVGPISVKLSNAELQDIIAPNSVLKQ